MTLEVGMQHRVLVYYQVVQMMTVGWPWPILWQGQIWSTMLLYGKKVKQCLFFYFFIFFFIFFYFFFFIFFYFFIYLFFFFFFILFFSESIVVYDSKVGRCSQPNDFYFTSNLRRIKVW